MLNRIAPPCLAVVFALAGASPRAAEPLWEPLPVAMPGAYVEVDRSSLGLRDGRLTLWLRLSFDTPVRGRELAFRSVVAEHVVDCRTRRHAPMRMTTYSLPLGDGDVIDRWDRGPADWRWSSARRGGMDAALVGLACAQAPATVRSSVIATSPA